MDDITEAEAPQTVGVVGPRGGKQDKNISIRLPSALVEELDQIAQDKGEARSELIRSVLAGTLAIAGAGYSGEQIVQVKRGYLDFYRWISDPVESIMYLIYKTNMALAEPDLQKKFAVSMAKNVIAYAKAVTPVKEDTTLGRFQRTVGGLDDVDEKAVAEKFLENLQESAPTGALGDRLRKASVLLDEETEDADDDEEALIQTSRAEGQSLAQGFAFFVSHLEERIKLGLEAEEVADTLAAFIFLAGTCDYYKAKGVHPLLRAMADAVDIQAMLLGAEGQEEGQEDVEAFIEAYLEFCLLVPPLYDNPDLRLKVSVLLVQDLFNDPLLPSAEIAENEEGEHDNT